MLPRQVSMLCWANEEQGTPTRFINLVDPEFLQFRIHKLGGQVLVNPHFQFFKLSLLGLMAKIKCSICSYQFNIWYAGHSLAHILIWFLAFGQGSEACLTLTTGCLGVALQPSAAHLSLMKSLQKLFAQDSLPIFFHTILSSFLSSFYLFFFSQHLSISYLYQSYCSIFSFFFYFFD